MRAVKNIALMMQLVIGVAGAINVGTAHAQDYFGYILPDTMCHAGETVLFACDTKHAKKIAACARPADGTPFGDIRYRFGTQTRTELEFPTEPQPVATYASGASMGDGGRGELTFLSLKRANTTYSVYSKVVNPTYQQDGASESNGVLVERAGKGIADIHCDAGSIPHAGKLADSKLFGVAVPLATKSLSILPEFNPPPLRQSAEIGPSEVLHGLAVTKTAPAGRSFGQEFADLDMFKTVMARDGNNITSVISGEIAGLGVVQAVLITHPVKDLLQQIMVLAHATNGHLRIAAQTHLVTVSDVETSMRIEHGSLFVRLDAPQGAWGTYQFKLQDDGSLRLIGVRLHRADDSGEPNHDVVAVVDTDFNVVTGSMLFKRVGDSRPLEAQVRGPACYFDQFEFALYTCASNMRTVDGTTAETLMNTP